MGAYQLLHVSNSLPILQQGIDGLGNLGNWDLTATAVAPARIDEGGRASLTSPPEASLATLMDTPGLSGQTINIAEEGDPPESGRPQN